MNYQLTPIAHIETDFDTKFGVPRQSGLIDSLEGRIVFEPDYRIPEAFRGLEGFSHIWLLWDFSEARLDTLPTTSPSATVRKWSPTVRPPRLGGNRRMGVFATRSPFRPNNIGLSSVELIRIDLHSPDGPVLFVRGADLMNGTPIFDIKPYLPFTDSHPDATGGFTDLTRAQQSLEVIIPDGVAARFNESKLNALREVLSEDPRPHYQADADRIYGMEFAGQEVKFRVEGNTLKVLDL